MLITSRYDSRCPCCRGEILAGERVEWTRGSKVQHEACAVSASEATTAGPGTRSPLSGCPCGSRVDESRETDCEVCAALIALTCASTDVAWTDHHAAAYLDAE